MTVTVDHLTVVPQPKSGKVETVSEAVYKQFKAEVGNNIQQFNLPEYRVKAAEGKATPAEDVDFMLRQKYGLIPTQPLPMEDSKLVAWEKRKDDAERRQAQWEAKQKNGIKRTRRSSGRGRRSSVPLPRAAASTGLLPGRS